MFWNSVDVVDIIMHYEWQTQFGIVDFFRNFYLEICILITAEDKQDCLELSISPLAFHRGFISK